MRYLAMFFVGLLVGVVAVRFLGQGDQGDVDIRVRQPESGIESISADMEPATVTIENDSAPIVAHPRESMREMPSPRLEMDIPEAYLRIVGSTRPHLSFGERVGQFQTEPRDEIWASAMEAGINSYVAASAPTAGAVFEYIQCRSTACILAGYVIDGKERQSASMLGELQSQGWWDGGNSSHSMGGTVGEQDAFVILFPRYDRQ